MPTYEYRCPAGHEFEVIQKISAKPRTRCPECQQLATRKISGGAGLVFKGSGFYITDYGKDGKGPRKPESDGAAAESPMPSAKEAPSSTSSASAEPSSPPAAKSPPPPAPSPTKRGE